MKCTITCTGYDIVADWYQGSDPHKILLIIPGFGSSKSRQKQHAEVMLRETGTSVLVIDLSGHGNSPFRLQDTRPAQHFLELIAAFDWLTKKCPEATVSVSGSSYGGFLAVQLTKYRAFANLILRAPAIYKPAAFYDLWSLRLDNEAAYTDMIMAYRINADLLAKHPLLARASSFAGRTLVVVHEDDEIVPRATTDAYIHAFSADSFIAQDFTHIIRPETTGEQQLTAYHQRIAGWLGV